MRTTDFGLWNSHVQAIVKYRAEAASTDKISYYTQILAQQMSAEQKIQAGKVAGVADRMAEIQLAVALKQMKDAYERPEVNSSPYIIRLI
jgi:N-terminal acetyltransferase B complex non-catalytic subunit